MEVPTAEWIRQTSNVNFVEYNYPVPTGSDPDRLDTVIAESVSEFQSMLGIDLAAVDADTDKRVPLLRKAIRMLTEFNAGASQQEILETATDFDMVQSFGASNYNEGRRNITANRTVLHPWPALNRLLLGIAYFDEAGRPRTDGPVIGAVDPAIRPGKDIMEKTMRVGPWRPGQPLLDPGVARANTSI